ncbi:glycoside hydrolase family 30 protein [Macrolepiota fuliginosa MF-IS2]|uniref:Glycoside hydrolase family 30 protein n=1 Tax=Macrolepiota fuliginosa MF-IS2 TaxID=1400762 RepID=A0A9P6BZ38_9AGAR|nr:glycoside hydrolase family 30 protein [Macrolepiota fuliginosa MF-IS2]
MQILSVFFTLAVAAGVSGQYQIWDLWQTTWDRSKLFTYHNQNPPIPFGSPSQIGDADIVVTDTSTFQSVWGFGGSLTDSSASTLNNLKNKNSTSYWNLLNYLFNPTDAMNAAGFSYMRIPLGASDFSASAYSYDDTSGDTSFSNFDINHTPSTVFSVLKDIQSLNNIMRIHIIPWSPPGWMKDSGTMDGGALKTELNNAYATYLLKCVQGFTSKGFRPYAISVQNEPLNTNPTYPTCKLTAAQEGQIAQQLRSLLDSNGFSGTKIIGYDHNWSDASSYPVQLMQDDGDAFDGVSFHCYAGSVGQQDDFHAKFPDKQIYFTECSGTFGSDWWSDIKWDMDNIPEGAIEHNSHTGLMWNIALDGKGNPKLPGTSSCGGPGCRAIVTVNSDGTWSVNQEFYSLAQASKAILPRDVGGPWGKRILVAVGGQLSWALRVSAFVTGRANASDWLRYSLVVLNWNDSIGGWNPQPVRATIEFRGTQATYTFPVGVTTLWWYAPPTSLNATEAEEYPTVFMDETAQGQTPLKFEL